MVRGVIHKLRGMFAFCVVDLQTKQAWLVRDHVGIKPLYYVVDNNILSFASEAKTFINAKIISPKLDPIGLPAISFLSRLP
jgi:asparagine synthase (glutamine-hydrolysing)